MKTVISPLVVERVSTTTTSGSVRWFTPFYATIGLDFAQFYWLLRAIAGVNPDTVVVYQTATFRQDNPDAPALFSGPSALTAAGEASSLALSLTSIVSTKFWIRFGLQYKAASAALAEGDIGMQAALLAYGDVLGSATVDVFASNVVANPAFQPICAPIPALGFGKLRLAYNLETLAGNIKWKIAYRSGPTSLPTMGAWSVLASESWRNTLGEGCTAELTQTVPSGHFWVQFGVAYGLDGGSTDGGLVLSTLLGVRP